VNRIIPLTLATALFMENMDSTVIATSLPAIAEDIGTTPVALKLAFTAYFVALAIFIPVSAWVSDRFGAKNVFRAAIIVFILGSVACALSGSLPEFVMARFLKGIGGAMMAPLARLILVRTTEKPDLVNAMAWLTIPALVAPTIGPPIGGFLTTFLSWHWIFLINVPIGLIGIALVTRFLPEIEGQETRPLDWFGFILTGIAFSGVVFGLSLLSMPLLPVWVAIVSTVVGFAAGAAYVLYARRVAFPLLDLRVFANAPFRTTVIGTTLFLIGVGAVPFLLPLMLQLAFGYSPFESGLIVFVSAFGALLMKFVAKPLFSAVGFRTALLWSTVLSAILIMVTGTFVPETPIVVMMTVIFASGLVRSVYFTGQNALAFAELDTHATGPAAAIHAVMRPIATALGVAVAGIVLEASAHLRGDALALPDFHFSFLVVGGISLIAVLPFITLRRDAGTEVSGHMTRAQREALVERSRTVEARSPRF